MTTTSTIASTDLAQHPAAEAGRGWALAGLGAALSGGALIIFSSMTTAVYEGEIEGDAVAITERLSEQVPQIVGALTTSVATALLLVVFAVGLHRHLVRTVPSGSLLPGVAVGGIALTTVPLIMGSALTTEFAFGLSDPTRIVPETAVFYGHWLGTVPFLWGTTGLAAFAVAAAARRYGAFGRGVGWVSLVLGVLLTLLAMGPLQYMAGMIGPVWVLVVSVAVLAGRRG